MCIYMYYKQAKDMVSMVNKFATKIEEKKGSVSDDEAGYVKFINFIIIISSLLDCTVSFIFIECWYF